MTESFAAASISRRTAVAGALCVMAAQSFPLVAGKVHGPLALPDKRQPLVFGHRGAPAHFPEHTLASYGRAIADGADYVEPDLVSTKDGVLVVRHENNLAETTDVSARSEFADRKATRSIDGLSVTGWFSEDFTLTELKRLRAKERLGPLRRQSSRYDGQFQVVTFEEVVDFVAAEAAVHGRDIGIIPELKHSTYFSEIGLPLEQRLLQSLASHAYLGRAPVIVQSFEIANLQWLRGQLGRGGNVRLMQLTENSDAPADRVKAGDGRRWQERLDPAGMAAIANYADFVAPWNRDLIPVGPDGTFGKASPIIADARAAGLLIGTWTFRPENYFLPLALRDGAGEANRNVKGSLAEIQHYLDAGIDGFFTDDPAIGRAAVAAWRTT